MNKSLFLVTSAIYTRFGVYDCKQRLDQTIDSLESIKKYCDADIILIDAGQSCLTQNDKNQLFPYVINVIEFSNDETIKKYQTVDNYDVVKSLIEITILKEIFNLLISQNAQENYNRIFKLSGRYVLNENFNYQQHIDKTNKVTIKKSSSSLYDTEHWVIQEFLKKYFRRHMTRLWSFDSSLLSYIFDVYTNILNDLINLFNQSRYLDLEHLMYCHLDPEKVSSLDVIGVQGNIAPNGVYIVD